MEKICYIFIVLLIGCIAGYVYTTVQYLLDMFYARACLIDNMDSVIRLLKFQQIILSEVGIPCRFSMSRQIFTRDIKSVHTTVIKAFLDDYDKCSTKLSPEYLEAQKTSYTDNINAINLALLDYDASNVRYSNDIDHIPVLCRLMPRYDFLDQDIAFRKDNGIKGTSAIGGNLH